MFSKVSVEATENYNGKIVSTSENIFIESYNHRIVYVGRDL